mmetsp:Transcript_18515/g.51553  ORF Transcript_18515/g.51553 Transcript_18515/m.51553 type:complete len:362 (-) Transcript_18515:1331-2416(-)
MRARQSTSRRARRAGRAFIHSIISMARATSTNQSGARHPRRQRRHRRRLRRRRGCRHHLHFTHHQSRPARSQRPRCRPCPRSHPRYHRLRRRRRRLRRRRLRPLSACRQRGLTQRACHSSSASPAWTCGLSMTAYGTGPQRTRVWSGRASGSLATAQKERQSRHARHHRHQTFLGRDHPRRLLPSRCLPRRHPAALLHHPHRHHHPGLRHHRLPHILAGIRPQPPAGAVATCTTGTTSPAWMPWSSMTSNYMGASISSAATSLACVAIRFLSARRRRRARRLLRPRHLRRHLHHHYRPRCRGRLHRLHRLGLRRCHHHRLHSSFQGSLTRSRSSRTARSRCACMSTKVRNGRLPPYAFERR